MSDSEGIDQYNNAFQQAMQQGDSEACASLCVETAILMPPEELPVKGHDAIRKHFADLGPDPSVQGRVIELEISGDLAYQHSQISWRSDGGISHTDSLDVLQKQDDGRWLLLASSWNTSSGFSS